MGAAGLWNVPGYAAVRELGAGGGGRVVLAAHEATGSHVAIKYLSEELRGEPGFLDRFRDEARLLVEIDDPHVVQLYEYVESGQGAAIVMELVNGTTLRALLRAEGATGPEAALAVLKGSLLGLSSAHEMGVVHRDYKPENVLVQGDGASKLADFGVAVRAGGSAVPAGTPPYMAPEQWTGVVPSAASDVYAATAVFFECLTGHRPYEATEQALLRHLHQTAPIPADDVPEPVRGLVERGLAKDPALRPASAAMFVAELEEAAAAAYGADWEERGRRRLAALAAALAATFPLNRPEAAEVSTSLARTVLQTALRAARRKGFKLTAAAGLLVLAAGGIGAYALDSGSGGRPAAHPVVPVAAPAATPASPAPLSPSPSPSVSPSPTGEPSATASTQASATPPDAAPPTSPASPSASAPAATAVASVTVGGLSLAPGASRTAPSAASGTVTVATSGTGKVALTVRFTLNGETAATEKITLNGARKYTRTVTHALGGHPCSGTWGITATTAPAARGGSSAATAKVPACPTAVTGLKVVSLKVSGPRTATAQVQVTADGTGPITLNGAFDAGDGGEGSKTATLSGKKSYTRTMSFTFPQRVCGRPVTFTASTDPPAPSASASRTVQTGCPAAVTSVAVARLARVLTAATTAVTVTTENAEPVRLTVTWLLAGKAAGSESVTLSGKTSYTVTLKFTYPRMPCGKTWGVTAATAPAAASGAATLTKKTGACVVLS